MIVNFEHGGRTVAIEFKSRGLIRTYGPGCDYTRELLRRDLAGDIDAMIELEGIYDRALAMGRER